MPAGAVQPVVAELLSAQYDTTQEPPAATFTAGAVCVVRETVSPAEAEAEIGAVWSTPEYADSDRSTLVEAA